MKEDEVKNILGRPKHESIHTSNIHPIGPYPVLPENITYHSLYYQINHIFFDDQSILIFVISAEDYSNLTGQKISDNSWRVVEKYMYSSSSVF
jgi:hypothetical protein